MPAWTLSLLVHVVLLLALALVTAVVVEREPEVVIATSIVETEQPLETMTEIVLEEPIDEWVDETPQFEPTLPEMPKLAFDESAMQEMATAVADGRPMSSAVTGQTAGAIVGSPPTGVEMGRAISFYGAKSTGNRFVFLIDNSPNMNHEGRMLMALDQLLRAVNAMDAKQSFYVVFYSNQAYPLYFPNPAHEMVPATSANKQILRGWLSTVELCDSRPKGADAIRSALAIARSVRPSTVFFLTDGDYATTVQRELQERPLECPLNVIGLLPDPNKAHTQAFQRAAAKLATFDEVARGNQGVFSGVPSSSHFPAGTYHPRSKDAPGPVWGTYQR